MADRVVRPHISRESQVQDRLADTRIPVPRSLALDAPGSTCGHPAHLMTLLPGHSDRSRADDRSLDELVRTLAEIHATSPPADLRAYQSWAWEAKYVVPLWTTDPSTWEEAFELLRTPPPVEEACLIHRDFHLRNVLWSGDSVSGVVDWVESSLGPPWLDVAHCCTNLTLDHGNDVADRFAAAYAAHTGRAPAPYFDVMDIVGFLPPPGGKAVRLP